MKNLNEITPQEMYVGLHIRYFETIDLLNWVRATPHLDIHAGNWRVGELLSTNSKIYFDDQKTERLYFSLFEYHWEKIELPSPQAEKTSKQLLKAALTEYIDEHRTPYGICKILHQIEPMFDYPEWVGDLYNGCDWVEQKTNRSDAPYLEEVAQKIIKSGDLD